MRIDDSDTNREKSEAEWGCEIERYNRMRSDLKTSLTVSNWDLSLILHPFKYHKKGRLGTGCRHIYRTPSFPGLMP